MKTNTKVALATTGGLILVVIAVIVVLLAQAQQSRPTAESDPMTGIASATRGDSHILDNAGDGAVTVVEFLDAKLVLPPIRWWRNFGRSSRVR